MYCNTVRLTHLIPYTTNKRNHLRVQQLSSKHIASVLSDCFEGYKGYLIPQYRTLLDAINLALYPP